MRYLAGCSHTFGQYGWSNRHMSRECNTLEEYLLCAVEYPKNFLDKDHVLNIFGEAREELLPFDDFLKYNFEDKEQRCAK